MVIVDDLLEGSSNSIPPYASPNPSPARGIYGFALFVCSWFFLALYLIWAIVPTPYLESLHLTYLPAKYWAIAIPLLLPIAVAVFIILVLVHNFIQLHGVFEDVEIIEDDFGRGAGVGSVDLQSFLQIPEVLVKKSKNCTAVIIMLRGTLPTLKSFSFSLLPIRQRTHSFGRRLRRKTKTVENIPTKALSVSKINELMRKRLEASWVENKNQALEMDLDSLSANRYLEINANKYASIVAYRQAKKEKDEYEKNELTFEHGFKGNREEPDDFPLAGSFLLKADSFIPINPTENSPTFSKLPGSDRGFYVYGDGFVDEFVVGSTTDIPGGELENVDDEIVIRYGAEDAVEEIDFQLPGQSIDPKDNVIEDEGDEILDNYGTVDPSIPSSSKFCGACGANFHCRDASLPGFLPAELNVNVCEVDYRSMMKHLKLKQEVLIILVVDMCDLPGSIYSELPKIIGYQKPMIVVGNKVDLLPPDAHRGFLRHFRQSLYNMLKEAGFVENFNILNTSLISAKTGYGVEDLITQEIKCFVESSRAVLLQNIFLRFSTRDTLRNDMYLVGCTNAGKSTLFNSLLQSDLCKVRAVDLIERAATTPWPGTTISLLKFPVMNPSPHKLEIRRRSVMMRMEFFYVAYLISELDRLLTNQAWQKKEERMRYKLYKQSGDIKYAMLQSGIGNSYKDREKELQPPSFRSILTDSEETDKPKRAFDPNSFVFAKGKWCFDTPGMVNSDQILNLFTLDELITVLPRTMIMPRTFIMHSEESLLVGGIAQVDVISLPTAAGPISARDYPERRPCVLLTVFASAQLPIFIRKTSEIAAFREKYLGSSLLAAPIGDAERIARFPGLKGSEMIFESTGSQKGCGDIVLSSLGWVCVTSRRGEIRLKAHTPEGRGLFLREPALLPFCAQLRGSRIGGTAAYKVKRPVFPDVLWIVTHCSALAVGYFIIACLINYSDGELLWNFFENWLGEKLVPNETNVRNMDVKNNSKRIHDLPWKEAERTNLFLEYKDVLGVTIPEPVNKLLEELIEQLIDNYVNSWYKTKISGDASFVNEIRYQIRYAVAVLYLRFQKIDLSSTILFEAVPLAAIHCSRVKHLSAMIDKNISSSQLVETKILEAMPDVHFALSSRENEVDYLRELADHLIGLIMDESCIAGHSSDNDSPFRDILTNHSRPWASHVCRHFLRELFVFSFLLPAMDLIADPDIINRLLVFLCDSDVLSSPNISQGSRQVEILHQLTDYSLTDTPDSLLQLKLSDMLRDTRQLMMFRAYLKDIHAPLNELDF
ncbi:Nitric oxide-associated protein 1 [Dirofilaria immitis]|nr:Nitric oxide-associated protein 1 [Dirofilaria immitis]